MRIGRAAAASTTTTTSATTMPPTPLPSAVAENPSAIGGGGGGLLEEEEEEGGGGGGDGEGEMGEEVLVLEARGMMADVKGLRWSFRQLVFPYMKVGGREGTEQIVSSLL